MGFNDFLWALLSGLILSHEHLVDSHFVLYSLNNSITCLLPLIEVSPLFLPWADIKSILIQCIAFLYITFKLMTYTDIHHTDKLIGPYWHFSLLNMELYSLCVYVINYFHSRPLPCMRTQWHSERVTHF